LFAQVLWNGEGILHAIAAPAPLLLTLAVTGIKVKQQPHERVTVTSLGICCADNRAVLQEHCCFVDVDGAVVTQADQLSAAIAKAATSRPSNNSTLQLLEADHVFNPDKQDAPGGRCYTTSVLVLPWSCSS
jgi:hypothetical protein